MHKVAVVMGSDSDWEIVKKAVEVLKEFGVEYEVKVASAHRTPDKALNFARTAREKGFGVIIAAAGMAAHLPGVLAAVTTLPVIGLPIKASIEGIDSLLSIAQMPPGVPVATVGINAAKNAGLLAVQILSLNDKNLAGKLQAYKEKLAREVEEKEQKLLEKLF
ncbi:5-(carboxyamino)imidazole ribonucleotide mutase [Carboxydothermus hydrogenoformans]|uniref:N5-carboxyaminoimidazole ribonucleotide mutase n=1 Tax=Carboxydothermus hydrogenoformans (strain ATCC BAA-161 / DSM 6008 / Z-2901) TaxID=246194 RepID=Q3AD69_CARHZ|nr:5-(carboxyamino)imidazole ribonucleotide mutase [Carboxydothermus hydrogenoformans]ABB14964.1 phosphoribosylaminoimidazole carboxylase, catalytic subunit [Carboxydothermus hydrogenoformans Z-2901]